MSFKECLVFSVDLLRKWMLKGFELLGEVIIVKWRKKFVGFGECEGVRLKRYFFIVCYLLIMNFF